MTMEELIGQNLETWCVKLHRGTDDTLVYHMPHRPMIQTVGSDGMIFLRIAAVEVERWVLAREVTGVEIELNGRQCQFAVIEKVGADKLRDKAEEIMKGDKEDDWMAGKLIEFAVRDYEMALEFASGGQEGQQ